MFESDAPGVWGCSGGEIDIGSAGTDEDGVEELGGEGPAIFDGGEGGGSGGERAERVATIGIGGGEVGGGVADEDARNWGSVGLSDAAADRESGGGSDVDDDLLDGGFSLHIADRTADRVIASGRPRFGLGGRIIDACAESVAVVPREGEGVAIGIGSDGGEGDGGAGGWSEIGGGEDGDGGTIGSGVGEIDDEGEIIVWGGASVSDGGDGDALIWVMEASADEEGGVGISSGGEGGHIEELL